MKKKNIYSLVANGANARRSSRFKSRNAKFITIPVLTVFLI